MTKRSEETQVDSTDLLAMIEDIESLADWHCDMDADPADTSPENMHAHCNGLILKTCARIKEWIANDLSEGSDE